MTGASAGIGRATALALSRAGVEVIAVARSEAPLRALAATAPTRVHPVVADVTRAGDRRRVRAAVRGPLVALVHAAGVFPRGPLSELPPARWREAIATNLDARFHLVRELRPQLRGARVLFVGSDAATTPRSGGGAYSVSQAASEMLWRCLREELGGEIAFLLAKPGLVATEMLAQSLAAPRDEFPAGHVYQQMLERGETIAPETVAGFFRWLLLDAPADGLQSRIWDIRDPAHHHHWLDGPLQPGRR